MRRLLLVIAVVVLFSSIFFSRSSSAAEIGLASSKTRFDVELLPGQSYEGLVTVMNQSPEVALPVHVIVSPWQLDEDTDDIEFVANEPLLNASSWFDVSRRDFILEKEEAQTIPFAIRAPAQASPGSYLVMMRFQPTLPEHYFTEDGPRFIPELGVLFFINIHHLSVDGDQTRYAVSIESFKVDDQEQSSGALAWLLPQAAEASVFDDAVNTFVAQVRNTGIYHFKASGYVVVKNVFGATVAIVPLPERYLLPGRSRSFDVSVSSVSNTEPPSFGSRVMHWLHDQSYLGPYRATMVLGVPTEGGEVVPVSVSTGFWIVPWKLGILVLALLITILFFVSRRKRLTLAWRALRGR